MLEYSRKSKYVENFIVMNDMSKCEICICSSMPYCISKKSSTTYNIAISNMYVRYTFHQMSRLKLKGLFFGNRGFLINTFYIQLLNKAHNLLLTLRFDEKVYLMYLF